MPPASWDVLVVDTFQANQQELQNCGAMWVNNVPTPDLSSDIHPIFAKDRWFDGRDAGGIVAGAEFYDRMIPALRLATKLITTPCLLPWWSHLNWGIPTVDRRTGKEYLKENAYEHTRRAYGAVTKNLLMLAEKISLGFDLPDRTRNFAYGLTVSERQGLRNWHHIPTKAWPRVKPSSKYPGHPLLPVCTLNYQFYTWMRNSFSRAKTESKIRFWFMLAVTLVHEVAHAYGFAMRPLRDNLRNFEMYHQKDDPAREYGFSWEEWVFHELINPVTTHIDPMAPLVTFYEERFRDGEHTKDWQGKVKHMPGITFVPAVNAKGHVWQGLDYSQRHNIRMVTQAVPVLWIAQWFRRSSWQRWDRWKVGDWLPPSLGPTFVVNIEWVRGVVRMHLGVKDENTNVARAETSKRSCDWELPGDYSAEGVYYHYQENEYIYE